MAKKVFQKIVVAGVSAIVTLVAWGDTSVSEKSSSLLEEKHCDLCHSETDARIGPPFKAIAALYRQADRDVKIEVLTEKIIYGGGGNWGVTPMIPNPHVTKDEASRMVEWILDLE